MILLGEMRDYETIQTAMTAAETGHLVLSSLHTLGAANTIERIMDVFEPSQQRQIAIQLSMVLQAVISQQLIPDVDGRNIPVFEIMRLTPAIRNMIRDNKIHQIEGVISTSSQDQMRSMDQSLLELYRKKSYHQGYRFEICYESGDAEAKTDVNFRKFSLICQKSPLLSAHTANMQGIFISGILHSALPHTYECNLSHFCFH
mgnify:CR=1 FL=1